MFDTACRLLETTVRSDTRQAILAGLSKSKNFAEALQRLRAGMRSNLFNAGANKLDLEKVVKKLDSQTRRDGFNILHDWDGKANKLIKETIPVDVLNYVLATNNELPLDLTVLAILLDYYLIYAVALLCLRAWDEGNANDNLDRLTQLLQDLQGPNGSGQRFVENAETLIFVATSHYEPDEKAYERLLAKVKTLDEKHRLNIALVHAAILGSHLRYGFEAQYGRDIVSMRTDNAPDYPWLCFSLSVLMRAYSRLREEGMDGSERDKIVEGILSGLSADARAFVGKPPASLSGHEAEYSQFSKLFLKFRRDLFEEFEQHRPSEDIYSPMSFNFNFPHNLLKGIVVDALFRGKPWNLSLNGLLTGIPREREIVELRRTLAQTLMDYARSSPDTVRGRLVPSIIYDSYLGVRNFAKTIGIIQRDA